MGYFLICAAEFTDLLFTGFEPKSFRFEIKKSKSKKRIRFEPASLSFAFHAATNELEVTVEFMQFSGYSISSPETTLVNFWFDSEAILYFYFLCHFVYNKFLSG